MREIYDHSTGTAVPHYVMTQVVNAPSTVHSRSVADFSHCPVNGGKRVSGYAGGVSIMDMM